MLDAVVEAVAELLDDAPEEVAACGLDHQGESVLAWDAESGRAAHADRHLAGQALPGGARPAGARRSRRRGPRAQRHAARPLLLRRQAGVAARARRRGRPRPRRRARSGSARSTASCATGSARASRPIPRPPRARSSVRRAWDSDAARRSSAFPPIALPEIVDTAGDLGTLSHPSWPVELPLRARCVDQQAALAGAGCVVPGRTKATYGTGVFVLAHVGEERPVPKGGLLPTVAWSVGGRVEWALDGGRLHRRSAARMAEPRPGARAPTRPRSPPPRPACEDAGGVRVLPALAGDWSAVVAARGAGGGRGADRVGPRRPTSRARRSRPSRGGSPTSSKR